MTVRTAELVMAIATILASIGLMIKSADNQIGWVAGRGPGAGAWPFWLSVIMLLASIATLIRWFRGTTPESRNLEQYIDRDTLFIVGITFASLLFLLGATHIIGLYFALFLFLLFYFKFVGRHDWALTILLVVGIPVFVFALFEAALQIPLPKAYSEEMFYPVYDVMYSRASIPLGLFNLPIFWATIIGIYAVLGAVVFGIRRLTPAKG